MPKSYTLEEKEQFSLQLQEITPKLPSCYGVLLHNRHPDLKLRKIYNVRHGKVIDWKVLGAMKELIGGN